MKKQSGFTLLELIIAMVIVGILATLAVPGFSSLMQSNNLSTKYNNLAGNISLARMEAVKRSTPIVLCASSNESSCNSTDWSDGWLVFVDDNGNNAFDAAGDTLLLVESAAPSYISITSAQFGGILSIAPRGRLASPGTILMCANNDSATAKALNLQVTGLGRLAADGPDTGDIVEDISGFDIDCS
jgi:type IV fimbrial biogenesis protein FimT